MKIKRLLFLFVLCFGAFSAGAQHAHHCSRVKGHHSSELRSNRLSEHFIGLTEEYNVHFYKLDVHMERTSTDIAGAVEIHATANVTEMDTFICELWDDFVIDEILLNGVTPVAYTRDESAVIIPVSFTEGENFYFEIVYGGTPPSGGGPFGGGGMSNASSPSWGNQVTWSLSEPFAAYEWFPCKQSLTDKADSVHVYITTDGSNMAGSNGILVDVVDVPGGKKRYEWESNYPIDYYLISVAIAEYVEYTIYAEPAGAAEPIMIQNFIYNNPLCLSFFEDDIDETADYLEYYSEIFGLYPFHGEKYGHCMAPIGGGMEHQTMTTQGYFVNWLTAHELGHQWFGNNVTCGSWADIWINEGFASYSEELMLEEFYPGDEVGSMAERHSNIMSVNGGSVWVLDSLDDSRIFSGRLTYDKGAAIVHTLRFLIGDDAVFFEILQTFQEEYADGTALGVDFKAVAESVSGLDFTAFFNEWYFGEGFPTYTIEYYWEDENIVLVLDQDVSMPGVTPFFTNDIEVEIEGVGGYSETIRLTGIESSSSVHVFPFPEAVESIDLDPNNWIINAYDGASENLNLASLPDAQQSISCFPNPAVNEIVINGANASGNYMIFDATGQNVLNGTLIEGNKVIDVQDLSKGQYYIRINGGQATFTKL